MFPSDQELKRSCKKAGWPSRNGALSPNACSVPRGTLAMQHACSQRICPVFWKYEVEIGDAKEVSEFRIEACGRR